MSRKLLSCILALMLTLGCISISAAGAADAAEPVTIKMTAVLHPNTQNLGELPIYQAISEKTGVNIEWTCYT